MFCFLKLETPQQDTFGRPDLPLRVFPAPGLDDGPGDAPITEQGLCGRITLTPAPTQPRGAGVGVSPAHPLGFLPGSMSALITTSVREYPDKSSSWPARVQAGHLPGPSWKQRQQREPMCRERLGSRWPDPKDRLSTVSTSLPPFPGSSLLGVTLPDPFWPTSSRLCSVAPEAGPRSLPRGGDMPPGAPAGKRLGQHRAPS